MVVQVSFVIWPGQLTVGVQITNGKDESVHWVVLSDDDVIGQVFGGGCFKYFDLFMRVYFFVLVFKVYFGHSFTSKNNHRKINTLEEIEILKAASSKYLLNDVITGQNTPISLQFVI